MKKNQLIYLVLVFSFFLFLGAFSVVQAQVYVNINKNQGSTQIRQVTLYLSAPAGTRQMMIANNIDFTGAKWESYTTAKSWTLDYGSGIKTVYVKFKNVGGTVSSIYKSTITLNPPREMGVEFEINDSDKETNSRYVSLKIKYSTGVEDMIISNANNFADLYFQPVSTFSPWVLTKGSGDKTVYMQFKDANGNTKTISRIIKYVQPENYLEEGSLVKTTNSTVYYLGEDGKLHPFISSLVYYSWYADFNNIKYLSSTRLRQYEIGQPVCLRPGTWLVKFEVSPVIHAVEPGCQLRPLLSDGEAVILYGYGWRQKVLEFSDAELAFYRIRSYSVADKVKGIIDRDRDGVSAEEEKMHGTSDLKKDSDEDGLSDYEEIYYWFSDPTNPDTDGDGYLDGVELTNGYPPTGGDKLTKIEAGTYDFPYGTIFSTNKGNYYYQHSNGKIYTMGSQNRTGLIKANNFNSNFIIKPTFSMTFDPINKAVASKEQNIYYPTVYVGNILTRL